MYSKMFFLHRRAEAGQQGKKESKSSFTIFIFCLKAVFKGKIDVVN
jgi:hypothetical protein